MITRVSVILNHRIHVSEVHKLGLPKFRVLYTTRYSNTPRYPKRIPKLNNPSLKPQQPQAESLTCQGETWDVA